MTIDVEPLETAALTALRAFLLDILPDGTEVIRGQVNRVASPKSPVFVVMTPLNRVRLGTNGDTWDETADAPTDISSEMPAQLQVQLDVHGIGSADVCQLILQVLRDGFACDFMTDNNYPVVPQYATDPRQTAFIDGENQYEDRWVMVAVLSIVSTVSLPQQFANQIDTGIFIADGNYLMFIGDNGSGVDFVGDNGQSLIFIAGVQVVA